MKQEFPNNKLNKQKMKAIWKGKIIAQSNETIKVENNHYFPENSVNKEFLKNSETHTVCPWKGEASYFDIEVDGETNKDGAWYYPDPKPAAKDLKNYVAFWRGVEVTE